tara:strand:- start:230 stop:979 length:750 start_codon:yes stop_codon:yes gene_type:complete
MKKNKNNLFITYLKASKKNLPLNFIVALFVALFFFYYGSNSKKYEVYSYLEINKSTFKDYKLNTEEHINEIRNIFRLNLLKNKKSLTKNKSIFLGPSEINRSLVSTIVIRTRLYGENFNKKIFDEYILNSKNDTRSSYKMLLENRVSELYRSNELMGKVFENEISRMKSLNYNFESLGTANNYFSEKMDLQLQIEGINQLIDLEDLIELRYSIDSVEPKILLSSIYLFILSLILFNFIIGIYYIGRSFV